MAMPQLMVLLKSHPMLNSSLKLPLLSYEVEKSLLIIRQSMEPFISIKTTALT